MALFKRRSPVGRGDRSSAITQNAPPQQQYTDSGTTPQYERSGPGPQYEEPGRNQQYGRAGRASQAVGTPRGTTRTPRGLPGGWLGEVILGLATLVIGLIVAANPTHSLNVLAVLLGVLMVVSGVYHVVRSLRRAGDHRMWGGIAGVLFFLTGIFLLRHIQLTLAIIALFAGFAFVIAGIAALAEAVSGHSRLGRLWSAVFGVICVFAGIAAITTPVHTLARLAIMLGWAFAAMGILHIIGAIVSRRTHGEEPRDVQISVPGQRAAEPANLEGAYGAPSGAQAGASSAAPASAAPRHRRSRL